MTSHRLFSVRPRATSFEDLVWAIDAWAAYRWFITHHGGGSDLLVRELVDYETKQTATVPRWREVPESEFSKRRRKA